MRRMAHLALPLLLGCVSPPAVEATTGILRGSFDTTGADAGNGFVFLYPGDNPPAPQGSGRPVQVSAVPEQRLFGGQAPDAQFVFSGVAPAAYLARGIIDNRHVFDPFVDVMAQPFAGDFEAPLVDMSVVAGLTGYTQLPAGQPLAWDPPMFSMDTVSDDTVFTLGSTEQVLSIIHLTATPLPFSEPSAVAFQFSIVDGGVIENFPEVVLQRMSQEDDGPEFQDLQGNPLQIVLAATAQPDPSTRNEIIDGQQVVDAMYVLIAPIAEVVEHPDGGSATTTRQLPSLPLGTYQITVLEPDGRYWQVPNGLAAGQPFAANHGGPYVTQGPRFEVVP